MASRQPLPISRYDTVYCNSNNQRNKYNHAPREDAQTKTMFLHVVIRTSRKDQEPPLSSIFGCGRWQVVQRYQADGTRVYSCHAFGS